MSRVLILGGVGFIGRNLVTYLANNNLASAIVVADKVPPMVAGLNDAEKALFDSDLVTFKQANLAREATIGAVFEAGGGNFDVVVNLCGATKYSQPDEVYQESTVASATTASKAAAAAGAFWVEVSDAHVYKGKKIPDGGCTEESPLDPWTGVARARLEAEEAVKNSGVEYVILRPALVYGPSDELSLTSKLVIGTVYKVSGKKMELLWSKSLKTNTVHVTDVCAAIAHVSITNKVDSGSVYNLEDGNNTDQGCVNGIIEQLYGINTGFLGKTKSSMASALGKKALTDYVNDKHLKPWSDLCKERDILDTPLTPYLDEELLYNVPLDINGTAIKSTGFNYSVPAPTDQNVREIIQGYIAKGTFPGGLLV